jgi:hypothetical protein
MCRVCANNKLFFIALTFSLNSLLVELALNRIPQHSQNSFSVKKLAIGNGDTINEYLQTVVIQGLQSDIDLYLGHSKNVTEIMLKKLGIKPFGKEEEEEEAIAK